MNWITEKFPLKQDPFGKKAEEMAEIYAKVMAHGRNYGFAYRELIEEAAKVGFDPFSVTPEQILKNPLINNRLTEGYQRQVKEHDFPFDTKKREASMKEVLHKIYDERNKTSK